MRDIPTLARGFVWGSKEKESTFISNVIIGLHMRGIPRRSSQRRQPNRSRQPPHLQLNRTTNSTFSLHQMPL